ncbi:MAG TPA: phosphoglycolate phosphatase [Hadesarchaea archaeon]|nr:phosphoglycolate phosphatase [Hadesarchaea archaeon]
MHHYRTGNKRLRSALLIRIIAIDIDGTVTFEDRKLDLAAVEAIRKAERSGIQVSLATGNVLTFAEAAAIMIGASGPLIAEDGGVVFDRRTGETCVLGDRTEADRGLAALERAFGPLKQTRSSAARLTGITLEREVPIDQIREVLLRNGLSLVAVDSGFAIHIRDPSVNKGNALRKLSTVVGVPMSEIAAIGDGPNDVEMLREAGISFAVANSPDEVKRVCTHVTKSSYGKGTAEAIELILNKYC